MTKNNFKQRVQNFMMFMTTEEVPGGRNGAPDHLFGVIGMWCLMTAVCYLIQFSLFVYLGLPLNIWCVMLDMLLGIAMTTVFYRNVPKTWAKRADRVGLKYIVIQFVCSFAFMVICGVIHVFDLQPNSAFLMRATKAMFG